MGSFTSDDILNIDGILEKIFLILYTEKSMTSLYSVLSKKKKKKLEFRDEDA